MNQLVAGEAVRLVLTTCPDQATAETIARALVEERVAACVNVLPGVTSFYRWQGAIERADERLLLIKTLAVRLEALAARLRALHPYDVPELLVVAVEGGSPDYVRWVVAESQEGL